jgi:hypothetical protein
MAIKSAMMTTAYDLVDSAGATVKDPFAEGAGHVDPRRFFDPGVIFDSGIDDWLDYLAGQGVTSGGEPVSDNPIDASDLNLASLAIGDLAGVQEVTRTITNVTNTPETYTPTYTGDGSIAVTFDAASYTVPAGGKKKITITVSATGSDYDEYATGFVTFTGSSHTARIPVAVRPLPVKADSEVTAPFAATGSVTINGVSGFTGTLNAAVTGLTGATPVPSTVAVGGFDDAAPAPSASAKEFVLDVPAGTDLARFDADAANNGDDLDLYVYKVEGSDLELVGTSATGSADEQVTLDKPAAGTYKAYVVGFASTTGASSAFSWTQWAVPTAAAGNLTLSPASQPVEVGTAFTVTGNFSGLAAGQRYLGRVHYLNGADDTGVATVVAVG